MPVVAKLITAAFDLTPVIEVAILTLSVSPVPPPVGGASDYVRRWTSGICALDQWAGVLSPHMARVGRLSDVPRRIDVNWGGFVAHLISNAPAFAAAYNVALREMRESRAALDVSLRLGYLPPLGAALEDRIQRILATLYRLSFPPQPR